MTAIALALTIVVAAIAALHGYWAAGGLWPGTSAAGLAAIVVGKPRMTGMPSVRLTVIVAAATGAIAAWPLVIAPAVARHLAPELAIAGYVLLAVLFLARGVAGFTQAMAQRHSAEPFATYNRKYYSPLCLALGAGFLTLAFNGGTL